LPSGAGKQLFFFLGDKTMTTITLKNGTYFVQFPYDPTQVQSLKDAIPGAGRRWDNNNKLWQVGTQYEAALRRLFPNQSIQVAQTATIQTETRVIELHYLGTVKDRGNNEFTAFGYAENNWSVVFPERILKAWFEGMDDAPPGDTSTLYGVLGLPRTATTAEIKPAYHRMARQWHPDVCREPGANETFLKISEAHAILSNPNKKARYDVGLMFAAQQPTQNKAFDVLGAGYRAPLRCGLVLADGQDCLGRFMVSKILGWEDIVRGDKTLVSSWPMGANAPVENWV
jgi:hypothetical protein